MKSNRQQTEAQINLHVWKDSAFKDKLKENPHKALKAFGMNKVPDALNIRVIEEDENQWVIRLHKRPVNFKQLSDAELEKAACGDAQEAKCCPKNPQS